MNQIIEDKLKEIQSIERMKECLELRLCLTSKDYKKKNEFEKNEIEIVKLETENKLFKLNRFLNAKREEFNEFYGCLIEELEFNDKGIE